MIRAPLAARLRYASSGCSDHASEVYRATISLAPPLHPPAILCHAAPIRVWLRQGDRDGHCAADCRRRCPDCLTARTSSGRALGYGRESDRDHRSSDRNSRATDSNCRRHPNGQYDECACGNEHAAHSDRDGASCRDKGRAEWPATGTPTPRWRRDGPCGLHDRRLRI